MRLSSVFGGEAGERVDRHRPAESSRHLRRDDRPASSHVGRFRKAGHVVPAGTVTLATSDADGAYRQATAHASMIPSQRGSARDLASQQHGVGGALQHLRRGFRRRAACSHDCAMNRGGESAPRADGHAGNTVDRFRPRLVSHRGSNAAAPWFARDPRRAAPCRHRNCQRRVRGYQAEPFGRTHRR